MDTQRDTTNSRPPDGERALPTILRGEEVLDKARDISYRIRDRVGRAAESPPPPDRPEERR
jgi:hypothetical protein